MHKAGKSTRKVRLADIAERAGVSTATVDRVIHNRHGVKPHTISHIRRVIEELQTGIHSIAETEVTKQFEFDVILPLGPNFFFNVLEQELSAFSTGNRLPVRFKTHRVEGFNPRILSDAIKEYSRETNGLAVVAIEDPMVRDAINEAVHNGVPLVTLVSGISNARQHAYVGLDNRAAGRTAGYLMGRFTPPEGTILLIAGSMSLRDHEEREIGFRRVLNEYNRKLNIVSCLEDHDDYRTTYKEAKRMLTSDVNLVGIYNIGAGNRGIASALQEQGRHEEVTYIGHELTSYTRQFLIDNVMDAVIDQNPHSEVQQLQDVLVRLNRDLRKPVENRLQNAQVYFRENLP